MLYHAKEERIIVGGSRMDYVSFGCGEKVMLIIPGLNLRDVKGSALPLAYMYRLFAKEYKVYVFDRKRDIPEGYTTEDIAEDIWEAMKLLNLEKAYVFGVSQGGMAALYLALKAKGILIRHFDTDRLRDYIRVTIGTAEEMAAFVETVRQILEENV